MRALGRVALAMLSAIVLLVALAPTLATAMLGAPGLGRVVADPAIIGAMRASVLAAGIVLAAGWPIGVMASLAIWRARSALRRLVLGSACVAIPVALAVPGLSFPAGLSVLLLAVQAAAAASVVLLILTGVLNMRDPRLLQTAAACGASPVRAWWLLAKSLSTPLTLAAASALAVGLALSTRVAGTVTLAGLVRRAVLEADMQAAPDALLLGLLSLVPLLIAGMLLLPGRIITRP